jgi:hypothetical protein
MRMTCRSQRVSIAARSSERVTRLQRDGEAMTRPRHPVGRIVTVQGPVSHGAEMPQGSSAKRERQYEHIKESYQDRGVSKDEAEERAARTVNKERREHGETKKER